MSNKAPVGQAMNQMFKIPLHEYTGRGGPGNVLVGHILHFLVVRYCPAESVSTISEPEGQTQSKVAGSTPDGQAIHLDLSREEAVP